jgi:hypothetical protein
MKFWKNSGYFVIKAFPDIPVLSELSDYQFLVVSQKD